MNIYNKLRYREHGLGTLYALRGSFMNFGARNAQERAPVPFAGNSSAKIINADYV